MSSENWGKLIRNAGGGNNEVNTPETILFFDKKHYVGRGPNADPSVFSHSQQTVIPFPYMSNTHFCIEMRTDEGGIHETSYFVTDHSRNGTFIRRLGAEPNACVQIPITTRIYHGDEIIMKFKGVIKLVYLFHVTAPSPAVIGSVIIEPVVNQNGRTETRDVAVVEGSMTSSSRKRSIEDVNDNHRVATSSASSVSVVDGGPTSGLLRQQVLSLQQESKAQECRLAASILANETLAADLSARDRALRAAQTALARKDADVVSVTDSLRATEANLSATEARLHNLEDNSEEMKAEISLLKNKASALVEDVKYKTEQVESRDVLLDDLNQNLASEKQITHKLTKEAEVLNLRLENTQLSNEGLQDTLKDAEVSR